MIPNLVHHEAGGHGEPLVLVHGYTGSSDDFAHVVGPLTEYARVTLVDQLGHGASPRVARYDFEALTEALVAFLEREFDAPVHLLGHSMGGRTVLPIAIERPDLVRSLILMDTWADEAEREPDGDRLEEIFARPQSEALDALNEFWSEPGPEARLITDRWGAEWAQAHWAYNEAHVDPAARYQLGQIVFVPAPGVLEACAGITCPTTVMCGEHDVAFVAASHRMAEMIPGAVLEIIEGAYHSPQLTHPKEWAGIISRHLIRAAS